MSRKMGLLLAVFAIAGISAQAVTDTSRRLPQLERFQPSKPGKTWQYCTLTETMVDDAGRVNVIVEGVGLTSVCDAGWLQVAEMLGFKIAPEADRKNNRWSRQIALDQMGELGWELVAMHRGELNRSMWVFKRER